MDVVEDPGFEPNDEVDELRWLTPGRGRGAAQLRPRRDAAVGVCERRPSGGGFKEGIPFAVAGGLLAISFGVLAHDTGLGAWGAILMSAVVFGGSAQFASVGILSTGGSLGTALLAATLVNSRFLPMGVALAPYLPGGPLKRALQGQPLVDPSWILARDTDGAFDRHVLFGASAVAVRDVDQRHRARRVRGHRPDRPRQPGRGRHLPRLLPDPAAGRAAPARHAQRRADGRADRGGAGAADARSACPCWWPARPRWWACGAARTRPRRTGARHERAVGRARGRLRGHGLRDQGAGARGLRRPAAARAPARRGVPGGRPAAGGAGGHPGPGRGRRAEAGRRERRAWPSPGWPAGSGCRRPSACCWPPAITGGLRALG